MDDIGKIIFFLAALFVFAIYQVVKIKKKGREEKSAKYKNGTTPALEEVTSVINPVINSRGIDDPYDFETAESHDTALGRVINVKPYMTAKDLWISANNRVRAQVPDKIKVDAAKKLSYNDIRDEIIGNYDDYFAITETSSEDSYIVSEECNENTDGQPTNTHKVGIIDDFDLKKAIIYSEILTPKF